MRKLLYVFALTVFTSISLSSCTEENIKPQDGGAGGQKDCQHGCP